MSAPAQDDFVHDPTRGWRMEGPQTATPDAVTYPGWLVSSPAEFASHSDVEIREAEA